MKKLFLLLGCISIGVIYATGFDRQFDGVFGISHEQGSFQATGNAGLIVIASGSADPCDPTTGQLCYDSSTQTFSGWIFLQTVGWIQMMTVDGNPVQAIVPADMNSLTPWTLTGYAWSDNAGWITLNCVGSCSYSGVAFVPSSTMSFTGIAWSDTLGYIEFNSVNADFANKVKVIGNIASKNSQSVNYDIGPAFVTVSYTAYLDIIHKNVALATRNSGINTTNTVTSTQKPLGNIKYYKLNGETLIVNSSTSWTDIDSIIVEGGDIEIATDITKDISKPKAIITIKNNVGLGGNIYIAGNIKNIYSSLIADGTIYSGENSGAIYNDTTVKISNLPKNQLYIYGKIISQNTFGGALGMNPSCPYTISVCDHETSIQYDFNYFRSFDKATSHKSDKTGYDEYSFIIESDPRVFSTPPSGM